MVVNYTLDCCLFRESYRVCRCFVIALVIFDIFRYRPPASALVIRSEKKLFWENFPKTEKAESKGNACRVRECLMPRYQSAIRVIAIR
jgi:hypothetical protein